MQRNVRTRIQHPVFLFLLCLSLVDKQASPPSEQLQCCTTISSHCRFLGLVTPLVIGLILRVPCPSDST